MPKFNFTAEPRFRSLSMMKANKFSELGRHDMNGASESFLKVDKKNIRCQETEHSILVASAVTTVEPSNGLKIYPTYSEILAALSPEQKKKLLILPLYGTGNTEFHAVTLVRTKKGQTYIFDSKLSYPTRFLTQADKPKPSLGTLIVTLLRSLSGSFRATITLDDESSPYHNAQYIGTAKQSVWDGVTCGYRTFNACELLMPALTQDLMNGTSVDHTTILGHLKNQENLPFLPPKQKTLRAEAWQSTFGDNHYGRIAKGFKYIIELPLAFIAEEFNSLRNRLWNLSPETPFRKMVRSVALLTAQIGYHSFHGPRRLIHSMTSPSTQKKQEDTQESADGFEIIGGPPGSSPYTNPELQNTNPELQNTNPELQAKPRRTMERNSDKRKQSQSKGSCLLEPRSRRMGRRRIIHTSALAQLGSNENFS